MEWEKLIKVYSAAAFKKSKITSGLTVLKRRPRHGPEAVVFALDKFRHYIEGKEFDLFTDHAALVSLLTRTQATGRLARWLHLLQGYNYQVKDVKGRLNTVPDALSRRHYRPDPRPVPEDEPTLQVDTQRKVTFCDIELQLRYDCDDPINETPVFRYVPKGILREPSHHLSCSCGRHREEVETVNVVTRSQTRAADEESVPADNNRPDKPLPPSQIPTVSGQKAEQRRRRVAPMVNNKARKALEDLSRIPHFTPTSQDIKC